MGGLMKFLKFVLFKIRCKRVVNIVAGSDRYTVVSEQKSNVTRFYWDQIESFTKNFSVVIGYGGFSTVYLAEKLPLAASTTCAAVKVQFCSSERLNRAHKQELEILLHLNHPHIVKLIGYCDDHEEGVLLFQYAPNGNLEEKLRESKKILSWRRRMIIAFQLAQAMEYLHIKQIVHGDIKASNILLDENLNCKLCDFGSAKMGFSSTILSPPADSPFTRSKNRIMMTGSPGYIDPHYLRTGLATKINDVYSFGIILLELLTGIEAFSPSNGGRLITRAQPMLQDVDKVVEMMDPRLPERGRHEVEARIMTALAATCLCDSPSFRPSSSDILKTMRDKISSISFFVGEKERSSKYPSTKHT